MLSLAKYFDSARSRRSRWRVRLGPPPACLYRDCVPKIENTRDLEDLCTFIATYVALADRCARDLHTVTGHDGCEWTCDDIVAECLFWCRVAQGMVDTDLDDADEIEEDLADVISSLRQVRDLRETRPKAGADHLSYLHSIFL